MLLILYTVSCYQNPICRIFFPLVWVNQHPVTLWLCLGDALKALVLKKHYYLCIEWALLADTSPICSLTFYRTWRWTVPSPFYSFVASRTMCPRYGGARAEPLSVWPQTKPVFASQTSPLHQGPGLQSNIAAERWPLPANISRLGSNMSAAAIPLTTTFFLYLNEVSLFFFPSVFTTRSTSLFFQRIWCYLGNFTRNGRSWRTLIDSYACVSFLTQIYTKGLPSARVRALGGRAWIPHDGEQQVTQAEGTREGRVSPRSLRPTGSGDPDQGSSETEATPTSVRRADFPGSVPILREVRAGPHLFLSNSV